MKDRLKELIISRAVSFGKFNLSSGKISSFYINSKKILFHSESTFLLAENFWRYIKDLDVTGIGGIEVGAIPLISIITYYAHKNGRDLEGFFVRKKIKDHGSKDRIEGVLLPSSKVVIIDDVITTGNSTFQVVEEVEKTGSTVVAILCIVDREEGASKTFSKYIYQPLFTLTDLGINN